MSALTSAPGSVAISLTGRPGRPLVTEEVFWLQAQSASFGEGQHQANQSGVANFARVRGARRSRSCSATLQIIETIADPNLGLQLGWATRLGKSRRDIAPRPVGRHFPQTSRSEGGLSRIKQNCCMWSSTQRAPGRRTQNSPSAGCRMRSAKLRRVRPALPR